MRPRGRSWVPTCWRPSATDEDRLAACRWDVAKAPIGASAPLQSRQHCCSSGTPWVRTMVAPWTFPRLTLSFLAACLWETAPHFKAPIGALKLSPFRSPPCFIVAILAATIDRWLSSKRRGARTTTADIKMGARAIFRLRAQPSSLSGSGSLKVCACRGCLILRPRSS